MFLTLTYEVEGRTYEFSVRSFPCVIGRESGMCQLTIEAANVSRQHVRLIHRNGNYFAEDLQSRNGTFVNEQRIELPAQIKDGDTIRLGKTLNIHVAYTEDVIELPMTQTVRQASVQDSTSARRPPISDAPRTSGPFARPSSVQDGQSLSILLEISKSLNSSINTQTVLQRVIDAVIELTRVERGFLLLPGATGLEPAIARNASKEPIPAEQQRISSSALQEILEKNKPVCIFDAMSDESLKQQASIAALNLRTIMGVPLHTYEVRDGQEVESLVGLIYADSTQKTPSEAHRLLDLLAALAGHAANAIANAQLHERLLEKERLEEDLKIAREIQESLLPQGIPIFPGLRIAARSNPRHHVGGDYFLLKKLARNRLSVGIGDVMGKGLPASLMMAALHAGQEALTMRQESLVDIMSDLNTLLTGQKAKNRYITFFNAIWEDPELVFVNAGHNSPLVFQADGGVVALEAGGMILGVMEHTPYVEGRVTLDPGDLLLLYTDGLIEAENPNGEQFGEERLKQFGVNNRRLSPDAFLDRLRLVLDQFCAGVPLGDDLTLIALAQGVTGHG